MYIPLEETTSAGSVFSRLSARVLRSFPPISLIFIMAVTSVFSPGATARQGAAPSRPEDRVMELIIHLADQAHLSQDRGLAVRAQAQAGLLVWPYNRDQARAIFRRAFSELLPSAADFEPASAVEIAQRQQLRIEFLCQIAGCDPEMAETLAYSFVLAPQPLSKEAARLAASDGAFALIASHGSLEAESRELLVSVALRMAGVDKHRALALAQVSLEAGISPYFDRLLMRIGESDPALADRLFSNAVDYLERRGPVSLGDVHTLSFYLVSAAGTPDKDRLMQAVIVRFLNLACDLLMRSYGVSPPDLARRDATDQTFQLTCTGKYLRELLSRYLPERAAQLERRVTELGNQGPSAAAIGIRAAPSIHPCVIEQAASLSTDARKRDELYAAAAFAWLGRAELRQARQAAANIANPQMRDRVLLTVSRRLLAKARIKDAMLIVPLLEDRVAKTHLIVKLAQAAFALRNTACAKTLLNLAELEAMKIERPLARAQSLLDIVAGFSAINPACAFAVMQEAVKSLNEIPACDSQARNPEHAVPCAASAQTEDLLQLSFANSLTALARLDFDRALLLAQQLTGKEVSLIAQLAVCQGGCDRMASSRSESNEN